MIGIIFLPNSCNKLRIEAGHNMMPTLIIKRVLSLSELIIAVVLLPTITDVERIYWAVSFHGWGFVDFPRCEQIWIINFMRYINKSTSVLRFIFERVPLRNVKLKNEFINIFDLTADKVRDVLQLILLCEKLFLLSLGNVFFILFMDFFVQTYVIPHFLNFVKFSFHSLQLLNREDLL